MLRRSIVYGLPLFLTAAAIAQTDVVQIYAAMTFRPALEQVIAACRAAGSAATAVMRRHPFWFVNSPVARRPTFF